MLTHPQRIFCLCKADSVCWSSISRQCFWNLDWYHNHHLRLKTDIDSRHEDSFQKSINKYIYIYIYICISAQTNCNFPFSEAKSHPWPYCRFSEAVLGLSYWQRDTKQVAHTQQEQSSATHQFWHRLTQNPQHIWTQRVLWTFPELPEFPVAEQAPCICPARAVPNANPQAETKLRI